MLILFWGVQAIYYLSVIKQKQSYMLFIIKNVALV